MLRSYDDVNDLLDVSALYFLDDQCTLTTDNVNILVTQTFYSVANGVASAVRLHLRELRMLHSPVRQVSRELKASHQGMRVNTSSLSTLSPHTYLLSAHIFE